MNPLFLLSLAIPLVLLIPHKNTPSLIENEYNSHSAMRKMESTVILVAVLMGLFVGGALGAYGVFGLPQNKTKAPLCTNKCPNEDLGPLQVVFTPGWNCTSSASADCVPINSTDHNNTALLMNGCKALGLTKSLCLKTIQPLIPYQPPNNWTNPCDTNGICCPSDFPNCD
jgi:hypothetical protein